ncbi:hypothetical protein D3C78_1406770 [compost metagenome]
MQAYDYEGGELDLLIVRKVSVVAGRIQMYRDTNSPTYCQYEPAKTGDRILDDTDVDYGAVGSEVAA